MTDETKPITIKYPQEVVDVMSDQIKLLQNNLDDCMERCNFWQNQYSRSIDLLREIADDDGSRYNRPSYYTKVLQFLSERK